MGAISTGFRFFLVEPASGHAAPAHATCYITFLTSRGVTTTKISALSTGHGQGCAHCRQFGARNEDLVGALWTREYGAHFYF